MDKTIRLAHGSGGRLSHELIRGLFLKEFENSYLLPLDDQAVFEPIKGRIAFTTDSYVVDPIFFPGGDIGVLAVNGTINDLACCGARPLYLSLGLIIEEGFPMEDLQRITGSIKTAAEASRVLVVTGDTKVVQKGKADRIFINTSGIGVVEEDVWISSKNARPGDVVIISAPIAEHGLAILTAREDLGFENTFRSDTAPLWGLVEKILKVAEIHSMRDPTRGGLATALNEIAISSNVCITISEEEIPIKDSVKGACELLGLDPLYIANEGILILIAPAENAGNILSAMRKNPLGKGARIIGEVTTEPQAMVLLKTKIGGRRILQMQTEDLLPRIC
jgi:hydrogenase expression/formation protein HypE